jgi:hypothetical protein
LASAPDYLEPTVAWRTWQVVEAEEGARLSSILYPTLWPPRRELVAECRHRRLVLFRPWRLRPPDHGAPEESCRCGIYGTARAADAAAYLEGYIFKSEPSRWRLLRRVLGRVSLWGSVVECKDGWRASHAYPEQLFVPTPEAEDEIGSDLGEVVDGLAVYGVDVAILEGRTDADLARAMMNAQIGALLRRNPG